MAYTTIDNPAGEYFNIVLWTGNGSNRDITGVGFEPNFTWIKQRNGTFSHVLGNSISGDNKFLVSSSEDAEGTDSDKFRTFVSDGFQVGTHNGVNGTSNTYVGWSWKETATAGFDIVGYTGNGSARTISHSLSAVPSMMIVKSRSSAGKPWGVYHHKNTSAPATDFLSLNNTNATADSSAFWNDTAPTSSVFSVGTSNDVNENGTTYIAYLFAEKQGYSKFGSYTGNGSADGPFTYTGFKPAIVICKKTSSTGDWELYDNKRNGFNGGNVRVYPNANDAPSGTGRLSLLSNGFKITNSSGNLNGSGNSFIYMAFAESPFTSSTGTPVTAR
tara:strand:+ start:630 stop:1619 length:990 start_codon:yes stop_codon:yes gene_type:complete